MHDGRTPRRRVAATERRAKLLLAAAELFAGRGYDGTRIDDVAAAAGVTKPIVYRHFESKKALYLALLDRHVEDLPSFLADDGDRLAGLRGADLARAVLDRWLDYVRANSHAWLMLFRDTSGDAEIRARRVAASARAREVMVAIVAAQAGGRVPAEQIEPTAEALRAALAGLALWWIDEPAADKRDVLEAAVRIFAGAVAAPESRPAAA